VASGGRITASDTSRGMTSPLTIARTGRAWNSRSPSRRGPPLPDSRRVRPPTPVKRPPRQPGKFHACQAAPYTAPGELSPGLPPAGSGRAAGLSARQRAGRLPGLALARPKQEDARW